MTPLQTQLSSELSQFNWKFDEPLAPLTYAKIGGPAEAFISVKTPDDAALLRQYCTQHKIVCTILGGASNVIISDSGLPGVVLQYAANTVTLVSTTEKGDSVVYIASGAKTALAVARTVELGLTGLEHFLGVPGTIGGAIFNNAHYLTDLIDQQIFRVQVITPYGENLWLTHAECEFGYEQSRFQHSGELILGAEFTLHKGDAAESKQKIIHATTYRAKTQPLGIPSSGCMFRNPPNTKKLRELFPQFADKEFIPAGFLIDQAGLKGERVGDVSVSEKHAAWIINHGQGTSADVAALVSKIQKTILTTFAVTLETEVFFLSGDTEGLES